MSRAVDRIELENDGRARVEQTSHARSGVLGISEAGRIGSRLNHNGAEACLSQARVSRQAHATRSLCGSAIAEYLTSHRYILLHAQPGRDALRSGPTPKFKRSGVDLNA